MVGVWRNSDQALLASTSVDASGTLIGDFYYEAIAPVMLSAGTGYTLGAMYTADDNDSYISSPGSVVLDQISATNGVFPAAGDLGFTYPSEDSTNLARFGANAIWSVVPEPSGMLLLSLAASMFAMIRKR
ncbi:MAG: PEP-CTERM sorting domain-containing protein [Planctomycetota bacterium]